MHTKEKATAYTPQLSRPLSGILRRIAWYQKEPMTKTLEHMVREAAGKYTPRELCGACKGEKSQCETCLVMEQEIDSIINNLSATS
jgi:hypothetical protein